MGHEVENSALQLESPNSLHFPFQTMTHGDAFIIKTQVALFSLFIHLGGSFSPSTFTLVQIDLTFEIVTMK